MRYNPEELEKSILEFWGKNSIYQKAKDKNIGKKKFYFLDGPPYTSGKIHLGTAWNKALKDSILRYKRMRGFDVWDRAGYDMHGLPTENATQKKLGLKYKEDIYKYGTDKFIEECKALCIKNMKIMNKDFQRMAVWMDFDNAYQSITKEFMDGEWWLIKQAHKNKRLYEGLRTMTWCPVTESALAKHELEYRTVEEDSIFVKFKVIGKEKEYLVIWTTTPWTIPFNLAVMVNPESEYVRVKVENEVWIVASALAGIFISGVVGKEFKILEKFPGEKLEGVAYVHPFYNDLKKIYDDIKKDAPKAHTVLLSKEYVDTKGGSGLVHCAPGCGPEDYEVGHANGIPPFNNIDPKGIFPENMGRFSGLAAKKNDDKFIKALDDCGALIATTKVEHEYPHDWRHHQPVIFRTTKQWFFKMEDLKDRLVKDNEKIEWVPQAAFNAFDSWLKNLRDNSISKQRFWGTPLPIWRNTDDPDDYIVVGSSKELEKLSGQKVDDLHMSTVDKIEIKKDGKTYRRVPDVLDVWVDAGTASWNCLDYPHTKEHFERLFPADFILEGKDQIRGWFNLLVVASTLALNKMCFNACYMHGFINDSMGRKMSKSLGNVISPYEAIDKYGSDATRYYMIGAANPGIDLNYNFQDLEIKRRNLGILWNLHKFIIDIARTYSIVPKDPKPKSLEAKYIISRMHSTIKKVTKLYEKYYLDSVPDEIEALFLELSRTYIQSVRETLSMGTDDEKQEVLDASYSVLLNSIKMLAPVCPFITEAIYLGLKHEFKLKEQSVHMAAWPGFDKDSIDPQLETDMNLAQEILQSILSAREKAQLGIRWPVLEVIVETEDAVSAVKNLKEMLKSQANLKNISIVKKFDKASETVKVNFKTLGPDFGAISPRIVAEIAKRKITTFPVKVKIDGTDFELGEKYFTKDIKIHESFVMDCFSKGKVFLNKERSQELQAEGFAREIIRRVQKSRKDAELQKTNEIDLYLHVDDELKGYLLPHEDLIRMRVGAKTLKISTDKPKEQFEHNDEDKVRGLKFGIHFKVLS